MKTLYTITLLAFFTLDGFSQEMIRVNTKDLVPISRKYGLDSALKLSRGLPLFKIDTTTAIQLLQEVENYKRYTRSEHFFSNMAHNWNNKVIYGKTKVLVLQQLNDICLTKRNEFGRLIVLDDKMIISILKQNIVELEPQLIECYEFCDYLGDSLRKDYPSFFGRIPSFFTGETLPIVEDYKVSQQNCYKIMLLLRQMGADYFDAKKLRNHKAQLRTYERSKDIFRFEDHYIEYDSVIVNLVGYYGSIDELDLVKEPELSKFIKSFEDNNCWIYILHNASKGFLNLGCQPTPLTGYGVVHKVILIEKDRLLIVKVGEWMT